MLGLIRVSPGLQVAVGSGTGYPVAAIPEPGSALLLLAGLGGVALRLRRRLR